MNSAVKVSVVVPVYNAEPYLRQCLDSILGQTLKEIEVLCVDDGSTDGSPAILEEYREKDARLQVFHQPNLFAGAARNTGKAHAVGEYLVFWDSDDYFYETALEKMYDLASSLQADVCVCGGNQFYEELQLEVPVSNYANPKRIPEEQPFNMFTHPDYILNFTTEAPWNKMFRRAFVEEQALDFQPVRNGNDVYFVINALCLADRVTAIPEPLICYRKNQTGSLVGTLSKSPLTPLQAWMDARSHLLELGRFPEKSFVNKALGSLFYLLRNMCTSWEAFETAVLFLKNGGLERLSMTVQEEDYYYAGWHREALIRLCEDSPQEFLAYFLHTTYIQLTEATAKRQIQSAQNREKQQELKTQAAELKKQNKKLKADREKTKEKLEAQSQHLAEAREEITRLTTINSNARVEMTSLERNLKKKESALIKAQEELKKTRESWSFRIGKALMWLPGKIMRLFHK